jgi:hypothetical protein
MVGEPLIVVGGDLLDAGDGSAWMVCAEVPTVNGTGFQTDSFQTQPVVAPREGNCEGHSSIGGLGVIVHGVI